MIKEILKYSVKNNCSDIHIVSGQKPILRFNGDIIRIENSNILSKKQVDEIIVSLLNKNQIEKFQKKHEIDFAFEIEGGTRFRANAFETFHGNAIAIRPIANQVQTLKDLHAPENIAELLKRRRGLIIVSGPTGCGKSTTLAAMIDFINQNYACNIITIEDPIEYLHKSKKSLISQREVGTHTNSFSKALKASLRENPDIILVGELRDLETFSLALTAAETGHLVLATLHTSSAVNAITRIIDVFPANEQMMIRSMLANSLNAIILQRLIKTKENKRRAAFEILVSNNSVRNLIRENKIAQINSMMEIGSKHGMLTMKDSIQQLFEAGLIDEESYQNAFDSYV